MTSRSVRASAMFVALTATTAACLLAPAPAASAATTIEAAAAALGLAPNTYSVTAELPASGNITGLLTNAVKLAGSSGHARVVHLPAGQVSVDSTIRVADWVYIVAEPGTTITWKGKEDNFLRFAPPPTAGASLTSGVHGGIWSGDNRADTTVISVSGAAVQLVQLKVLEAGKNGIGAYKSSSLILRNVTTTDNQVGGVYVGESSTLTATRLRSTRNQRNGVQLASGSVGTITDSYLDRNGQAVRGSTAGKTGHGLGVAKATVVVSGTSVSANKVCGVSLTDGAVATISGSRIDGNGRHGLGTVAGTTATITDSHANDNGYNGVLASGNDTLVTLERVTISKAKKSGLSVPSRGTARVTGSTITGGRNYDISVSARGNLSLLGGNTITSSRRHGITVSGRSSILISGAGNQVIGSRGDGLRLTGSGTSGRITASASFRDNRDSGIVVVSKAKLQMVMCSFSGNDNTVEKRSGGKVTPIG